jgi:hypothetical protein
MANTPTSSLLQNNGSVPMLSDDMMQQQLTPGGNGIPAYNITDDTLFGDDAGDAMLGFEDMFDNTNMFDWVRILPSPFFRYSFCS